MEVTDTAIARHHSHWHRYRDQPFTGRNLILASFCPDVYQLYIVKLAALLAILGKKLLYSTDLLNNIFTSLILGTMPRSFSNSRVFLVLSSSPSFSINAKERVRGNQFSY